MLERIDVPVVGNLLKTLKGGPPELASIVIDLYDFSGAALTALSERVLALRDGVAKGKAFQSISVQSASGGVTYFVSKELDHRVMAAAEAVGSKHKYDCKCNRWYVVVDCIESDKSVDAVIPIVDTWKEDEGLANMSNRVGEMFKSRRE